MLTAQEELAAEHLTLDDEPARYDTLAREVGVDGKTAKAYVDVLERLFLVRVRRAWHVNLGQRQVKAPKLYVADPGLLVALIGADARRALEDDGFAGALFETFVATELERQASWSPEPLSFWHYRDGEREVDTVIERPSGEVVGIEVKAGATARPQDFRGLRHLRERLGERLAAGLVLYAGEQTLPLVSGSGPCRCAHYGRNRAAWTADGMESLSICGPLELSSSFVGDGRVPGSRTRHDVPRAVVWLLWPIYRRSESRSAREIGPASVYVLRGLGRHRGPVLRTGRPHREEQASPSG
jgi:hypothetical protein